MSDIAVTVLGYVVFAAILVYGAIVVSATAPKLAIEPMDSTSMMDSPLPNESVDLAPMSEPASGAAAFAARFKKLFYPTGLTDAERIKRRNSGITALTIGSLGLCVMTVLTIYTFARPKRR